MYPKIQTGSYKSGSSTLDAVDKAIRSANLRAINKTSRWTLNKIMRDLVSVNGMTKDALKGRRRTQLGKATRSRLSGSAWQGTNDLPAGKAGVVVAGLRKTQAGPVPVAGCNGASLITGKGAKCFEDSFVITTKSGHKSIFKRVGSRLVEQTMPVNDDINIDGISDDGIDRLANTIEKELSKEFDVKGG